MQTDNIIDYRITKTCELKRSKNQSQLGSKEQHSEIN